TVPLAAWKGPDTPKTSSLRIRRIVEQHRQLDTSMSKLREVGRVAICWIEVGGRVVRRKKNQRIQKFLQRRRFGAGEFRVRIAGGLRLSSVTLNHIVERHAATVMAVRTGRAYAPQRTRQKLLL